jgi:hypothetical protein
MTRAVCALLLFLGATPLAAQQSFNVMARGIVTVRHADPAPGGGTDTEAYLTQPTLSLSRALGSRLAARFTLSLESASIAGGELTPGAWGEGYVDRRHPHTTVHELLLEARDILGDVDGDWELGLIAGKGFAPFGTDDPMSRPFLNYPVNHHLAQVLERAVLIGQVRRGPVTLEAALFNGDEPESPGQWPLIRNDSVWRFGDSWSLRALVSPLAGLELQGSLASIHSPEHRQGGGGGHDKVSVSARWQDGDARGSRYALVEWGRSSELDGTFRLETVLAEAALTRGRWQVSARYESTLRPEEERLADPYKTHRPHIENSILGTLRWNLATFRLAAELSPRGSKAGIQPFVEVTGGHIARVGSGIADAIDIYGTDRVRHLSVGVVIEWQGRNHRMGRYGVLTSHESHH